MRLSSLTVLALFAAALAPAPADAATIALLNNPSGNATFVSNFQAFVESRGDTFVRNPTSYAGVDTVVNVRMPVTVDLIAFVRGGGGLLTEYSGITQARLAGLLDYSDTGGGNAGTGTPINFTTAGLESGLAAGLANPFSDGGATEFFRNGITLGSSVTVFATRGANLPAILGARAGDGYVLGYAFDWADGFIPNSATTRTLVGNGLDFVALQSAVPEPETWITMILGFGLIGGVARRKNVVRASLA